MTKYRKLREKGKCVSCQSVNDTPEFSCCSKCRERNRNYYKINYKWYAEHNICIRCHQQDAYPGHKTCIECMAYYNNWQQIKRKRPNDEETKEKQRLRNKKRYNERKEAGLCTKCGKPRLHSISNTLCNECRQKSNRQKGKAYYEKVDIPRRQRKFYGLCFICGEPYEPNGYQLCDKCRENSRQGALKEDKTKWLEWQRQENARTRGYRYKKEKK